MCHRLVFVAVLAASSVQAGTIIHVDNDNCPGPGSGTPGNPYCSIQIAIDNAVDTDEIVVAPGTYLETIDFLGKAITLRSSDGPAVTIIDATNATGLSALTVRCFNGEGQDTVLNGFTVTGGGDPCCSRLGGMWIQSSSPTVINCSFSGNDGPGMFNESSSATVTDCTFTGNSGGGMLNFINSNPTVANCTFSGNVGGGMLNSASSPLVTNCILWGDSPDEITGGAIVSHCDIQGGHPGTGNIDADPLFVDPDNGDFRLQAGSPCIDAGDNSGVPPAITTDLDGNLRFLRVLDTPATANAAATVTLDPIKDNTLFNVDPPASNGAGTAIFSGRTGSIANFIEQRAVLAFDLTSDVPAGSIVSSATLTLNLVQYSPFGNPESHTLHRILSDWGEGTSNSPGGFGAPATANDATWLHTFFNSQFWGSAGGDFVGGASATQTINNVLGFYTWDSTPQMVSDVQGWVDNPASSFGWLVMGNESAANTAKKFSSREAFDSALHPKLTIEYTTPCPAPIVDMGAYESGSGCLVNVCQEVICHASGLLFTYNVEGLSGCTGDTFMASFTGSTGAAGQDMCFTLLVNDQGGFCCSTMLCVPVPDCPQPVCLCDLDSDDVVGMTDFFEVLAAWGSNPGHPADFDADGFVGITDLFTLFGNWGVCQ